MLIGGIEAGGTKMVCAVAEVRAEAFLEGCQKEEGENAEGVRLLDRISIPTGQPEETLAEGERIIGGVVFKLKAWLRGYIILVSIDTIVYSTVFYLLGVPYAPILGFLAGCGLLLPYIGPIRVALFKQRNLRLCSVMIFLLVVNIK